MTAKDRKTAARSVIMDTSGWVRSNTKELNQKLAALYDLVERGVVADRSAEHQLTEIGIIEGAISKRNDR